MFFLASVPFQKHEVADYERRRYRGLDQKVVHWREERILKKIFAILGDNRLAGQPPIILDAPCGYGRFSGFILERGFRLVASDLSLHMVGRAAERVRVPGFLAGAVADLKAGLPFKPGVFFGIFSMRFFHHLHGEDDRRLILKEFARVSSGYVILSYYQSNRLHEFQRKLRRKVKRTRTRISMIPRRRFLEEVEAAGLQVVRVFPLLRGIHGQHIALLSL